MPGAATPIPVLLGSYNRFKPEALQQNLLTYNSSTKRLYDVPGRSASPYTQHRLFSAVPMRQQSLTGTESFVFNTGMAWGNTALSVNALQVDFGNGQGFVTLPANSPVQVVWADTGRYEITVRATLSDATTAECKAEYWVLRKTAGAGARYSAPAAVTPSGWGVIQATANHSGGTIQIIYSSKSPTGTLRKPLVVVENFDAFGVAPMLQMRPYTIRDLIANLDNPFDGGYDFNNELDFIAGYDLVFIKFANGTDAIERNAAVVTEALLRINAAKVLDDRFGNIRQQNVVLGLGTGGLNARYALAQYTKANATTANPNPTETRLLITHDAPHRGLNIALGLQHLCRMLAHFGYFGVSSQDVFPEYKQTMAFLQSPVMEQTLLYRTTADDANTPNTFINAVYQPMVDYASPYRFVATSLGNECARPLFTGRRRFVDFGNTASAGIKVSLEVGIWPIEFGVDLGNLYEAKVESSVYTAAIPPAERNH